MADVVAAVRSYSYDASHARFRPEARCLRWGTLAANAKNLAIRWHGSNPVRAIAARRATPEDVDRSRPPGLANDGLATGALVDRRRWPRAERAGRAPRGASLPIDVVLDVTEELLVGLLAVAPRSDPALVDDVDRTGAALAVDEPRL